MSKVVIEGRALELCRSHAATVVAAMPETFDDLRELFVGAALDLGVPLRRTPVAERRSPITRRAAVADDRRVFPPRPEGRRHNAGRRAGDVVD
jgi:hypothetical protein